MFIEWMCYSLLKLRKEVRKETADRDLVDYGDSMFVEGEEGESFSTTASFLGHNVICSIIVVMKLCYQCIVTS